MLPTSAARGGAVAGNLIVLYAVVAHFAVEAYCVNCRQVRDGGPAILLVVGLLAVQASGPFGSARLAVTRLACVCDGSRRERRTLVARGFCTHDGSNR